MKKNNELWKLDLLEAKYLQYHARYATTKKLLTARNDEKLWKRLPSTAEEAVPVILQLKSELFLKKVHGSLKKLEKELTKLVKSETKPEVVEFFASTDNMAILIKSRLIKALVTSILTTKELKSSPPTYISDEYRDGIIDKQNNINPSNFFINHCQNNKVLNGFISNLWNNKVVKNILSEIEWSFKTVRGDISREEKQARRVQTGKKPTVKADEGSDDESDEESSDELDDHQESPESAIDAEEAFEKYAVYDDLVGDSDHEDEEKVQLDPKVNYNEITDEEEEDDEIDVSESSEDSVASHDSFFKEDMPKSKATKEKKEKKPKLPELVSGYYSGGSDDEDDFNPDADEVVKEATKVRKNRRGQRARQQIWEKKYGSGARHVQETHAKEQSEREQKRIEYEERCRKRELKASGGVAIDASSGSNVIPLGDRKANTGGINTPFVSAAVTAAAAAAAAEKPMHPSWQAKKLAEEREKNVKFTGKKTTFE